MSMSVSVKPVLMGYVLMSCRFKMMRRPQRGMEDRCMFLCEILLVVSLDRWMDALWLLVLGSV